jgi:hypothetical protein
MTTFVTPSLVGMSKLQTAAKHLIERYVFEISPSFEGDANWRIIWAIERRFKMVGYGDYLERQYKRTGARARVLRARDNYAKTMEADSYLHLRDARAELAALT